MRPPVPADAACLPGRSDGCPVANLITLGRLLLVPFVLLAVLRDQHGTALVLFVIAAVSDVADGYIARHVETPTQLGARLDPIADKLLVNGLFIALAWVGALPVWLALIVLLRDALLLGIGAWLDRAGTLEVRASIWGKATTFAQVTVIALVLLARAGHPPSDAVLTPLALIVGFLCIVSALDYARRYRQAVKQAVKDVVT